MKIPIVLIVTVGGSSEPVISAIENNSPKFIFFICSNGTQEASSLTEVNNTIIPHLELLSNQYEIVTTKNPDDLGSVLNCCKSIHKKIQNNFPHSCKVIANYTGGTKTMSMGIGVYALQYPEWELQLQTRTRKNLIKVESGDISTKLDLSIFHFQKLEQELFDLEKQEDFDSACQRITWFLREFTPEQSINEELHDWLSKFSCFSAWNRFEYSTAIQFGKDSNSIKSDKIVQLKVLNNLSEALQKPDTGIFKNKNITGFEMVEDVITNAKRCAKHSRYDDAIGRLYRATELLAQTQLLKQYGIDTSNLDISKSCITPDIKSWLDGIKGNKKKYETSLMNTYYLLLKLGDSLGKYFNQNESNLKGFISSRNDSFFAHGYVPITKDIWKSKGTKWIKWIEDGIKDCV